MSACKCFPPNDTWLKIPDEGEILLDGINIKLYDLKSLRTKYFGAVSQEPTLFNGTIE